jgi:hypothetical protein
MPTLFAEPYMGKLQPVARHCRAALLINNSEINAFAFRYKHKARLAKQFDMVFDSYLIHEANARQLSVGAQSGVWNT